MNRNILIIFCLFMGCFLSCCKEEKTILKPTTNDLYGTSWKGKVFEGLDKEYIYSLYIYFDNTGKCSYSLYDKVGKKLIEEKKDFKYLYINNTITWDKGNLRYDNYISSSFWSVSRGIKKMTLIRGESSPDQDIIELDMI